MDGEFAAEGVLGDPLHVVVEVGPDDPLEEIRGVDSHFAERFAVVTPERDDRLAIAPLEPAVLVDVARVDRIAERVEFVERPRERRDGLGELVGRHGGVAFELGLEDFERSLRVGSGAVCALELLSAEELVCGGQIARLHLAEDRVGVEDAASGGGELDAATGEFAGEHRHVELADVVAAEIAPLEIDCEVPGELAERRRILHVLVRDVVNGGRLGRDGHLGVDQTGFCLAGTVGHDLDDRELHDPVDEKIDAGRFQVEKDQRYIVGKLHEMTSLK